MLQPEKQGLTGLFFSTNGTYWTMTLFLSWIFLPSQSPSIGFTPEGKIDIMRNRWITFSQTDYIAFSRKIEVFYWLEKIYLKDIILNKSLAAKFRLGDINRQWINVAIAHKPINKIYFRLDPRITIEKLAIENYIRYDLFTHYLFSLDIGVRRKWGALIASFSQEITEEKVFSREWMITPYLPDTRLFSIYFSIDIAEILRVSIIENISFKFLYSKVYKNFLKQNDNELIPPNVDIDINKYQILYGVSTGVSGSFVNTKNHRLLWEGKYMYSIAQKGGWLNAGLAWIFMDRFFIKSWVDVLGVNPGGKKGFFNSYQTNDRVGISIGYEFF